MTLEEAVETEEDGEGQKSQERIVRIWIRTEDTGENGRRLEQNGGGRRGAEEAGEGQRSAMKMIRGWRRTDEAGKNVKIWRRMEEVGRRRKEEAAKPEETIERQRRPDDG